MGYAQLNIKGQNAKIETISTARTGFITLKCQGNVYYIGTTTTNRFDDPFILYIGEDKDSAIQTLKDLINLCGNMEENTSLIIDNGGRECRITPGAMGTLYFHSDYHAGFASATKQELTKFLKALNSR